MEKKPENTKHSSRYPIVLNSNTVALIHIFEKHDKFEDIWMIDTEYLLNKHDGYSGAAKQFVEQLEEQWCDLFMESLALEIVKTYKESRSRTGSDEDFKKLLEKINKI